MRLRIIAVGTKMPQWVLAGCDEYIKRLPAEFNLNMVEIPLGKRTRGQRAGRAIADEGAAMLKAITPGDRVIALDVQGKSWSTPELAVAVAAWQNSGDNYCLLIGGPDGLAPNCLARADKTWSLAPLTLPHPLVRLLLVEQIYRAWTINTGHPYHR